MSANMCTIFLLVPVDVRNVEIVFRIVFESMKKQ